jgi:hypothetical protein
MLSEILDSHGEDYEVEQAISLLILYLLEEDGGSLFK